MSTPAVDDEITISASALRSLGDQMQRFLLEYRFAMQEVETKLAILQEEFLHMHEYNPIEHVSSRVKSVDSLVDKLSRRGVSSEFDVIRREIHDIAGVRVTCAFIRDVYRLFDLLTQQDDITVLEVEDFIDEPKANGYKSLHTIISVPVYLSTGRVDVPVEVQFRTIAMDFWASLEHKLRYKKSIPEEQSKYLAEEMMDCAQISSALDERMQKVRDVIMQAEEKEEEKSSGVEPLMLRGLTERIRQKNL